MGARADMKAVEDLHARWCSRGSKLCTSTLPEEIGDKKSHFNHDKVCRNASPRTRREWLKFILDKCFTLGRREPASMIEAAAIHVSGKERRDLISDSPLWVIPRCWVSVKSACV